MTIASEIIKLNTNLGAAYTAVDGKGGTLPVSQNFDNLATAISSIPSEGGVGIPREVKNGVYQCPTENFTFSLPSNVTDIGSSALNSAFYSCTGLTNVDLSSLTTVSGTSALNNAFGYCSALNNVDLSSLTTVSGISGLYYTFNNSNLKNIDLSSLTTVSGQNAFYQAFGYTSLTSISFPALTTISGNNGFSSALHYCTELTNVSFPALTTVTGSHALQYAFNYDRKISSISFSALTTSSFGSRTNQFSGMMRNTDSNTTHTIHFPSNMESTISGLDSYPLFGGTSGYVVLAFDLPATS